MSKIHTHYDNLKVSRMAPPEVIRAAYKALSQKYHPDKNPGDEKAARIMAILNSAYGTLSDAQRRREHDEWIAAEEWEIEWLESTRADEEKREESYNPQWTGAKYAANKPYRPSRDPKWWLILLLCVLMGWAVAVLMQIQFQFMPQSLLPPTLPQVLGRVSASPTPVANTLPLEKAPLKPADLRASLSAQVLLVGQDKLCEMLPRPISAPNGESWPAESGYIDGYQQGNMGGEAKIVLDNSAHDHDALVILFDLDKQVAVRHVFLRAHQKFTLENLIVGNYQVQQQVLGLTASQKFDCPLAVPAVLPPGTE